MHITLFVLSLIGGFFSGLLGVGGAVLLIPLLLTVPGWLGVGALSMHEVSGLTMLQVLAASITGWLAHRKSGLAHSPTIFTIGIPMGVMSFAGAMISGKISEFSLLFIFGCLVILAFFMLLKGGSTESSDSQEFHFRKVVFACTGSVVGFVAGLIGAGGGFILIPVMVRMLKIPMRTTVGSSLGIVFVGAIMGSLGKIISLQVEWAYLIPVVAGALPGSLLGARTSKRISAQRLRHILLGLVLLILLKTWYDIAVLLTA